MTMKPIDTNRASTFLLLAALSWAMAVAAAEAPRPVGVVSHVKVLSDKVQDVSSLEAWKRILPHHLRRAPHHEGNPP